MEGQVDLGFAEIFIGRAAECAIRTDDPLVSRRHARVFFQNGAHVIEDLQSANGIYLGEIRVPSHVLQDGDNVRCGNLWLRYANEQVAAYPGVSSGPLMSPSGGTQLLNVNEPFNPGRGSESGSPSPSPSMGGGGPMGMPPNPFGPGMSPQGIPPMQPSPLTSMGPAGFGAPAPMGGISNMGAPPPAMGPTGFGSMGGPPPPSIGGMGGPPPPAPVSISGSIGARGSAGGGGPSPGGGTTGNQGGGPPPPAPGPPVNRSSPVGPSAVIDGAEVQRMQRRIDQLTSELRMIRGGGDRALRMEELEERASRLEKDNEQAEVRYKELEKLVAQTGSDYNPNRANLQLSRAEEVITGLNDVLSELRINLLAAEGEILQYASVLPQASFEMVREAIRSSRMQMETARDIMRMLRDLR
jgi:hypothetical protein